MSANTKGQLTTAQEVGVFLLAGKAFVTLVSKKTGARFTYRVRKPTAGASPNPPHFVSVLTGSDNERSYQYLGTIFGGQTYKHGVKSSLSPAAPSAVAFEWFWKALQAGVVPESLEVWHEGKCGRCGRKLTVPESIAKGIGPECSGKMAA